MMDVWSTMATAGTMRYKDLSDDCDVYLVALIAVTLKFTTTSTLVHLTIIQYPNLPLLHYTLYFSFGTTKANGCTLLKLYEF